MDSSPVLNLNLVPGKFIDIPTLIYMSEIKSKKDRIFILNKFLEKCIIAFGLTVKIKNIYDYFGQTIIDLKDIPNESKFMYISTNEIFVGISVINCSNSSRQLVENRNSLLPFINNSDEKKKKGENVFKIMALKNFSKIKKNFKENYLIKNQILNTSDFNEYENTNNFTFDSGCFYSKQKLKEENIESQKFFDNNFISFKNYLIMYTGCYDNQSTCNGMNSEENYQLRMNKINRGGYFSDDEKNKTRANKFLTENFTDNYKVWIYFLEYLSDKNKFFIKNKIIENFRNKKIKLEKQKKFMDLNIDMNKNSKITEFNSINKHNSENNFENDIINLVDNFNKDIEKKTTALNNYMNNKKNKNIIKSKDCPDPITKRLKKGLIERTKILMKNFILGFQLFKIKTDKSKDLYTLPENELNKKTKYIKENKKLYDNIYYSLENDVNEVIPSLFKCNIPQLLEKYKNFSRSELYDLFVQYKILMKLNICINKDRKIINKGIDFNTFYKGVPEMSNESEDLAKKMFNVINESGTSNLSLDEFLKGMCTIKSEKISDKIDMFFKIIDSDCNNNLSWEEVYDISIMSLKRTLCIDDENSESIVNDLAKFFADLIFKLVDVEKDKEIPLPKIRDVRRIKIILFYLKNYFL